jgi:hypothetical protein
MTSVLEAARLYDISELMEWNLPARCSAWENTCRNFRADATRVSQRILFEIHSRPGRDPNTVTLDAATKERIRHHLNEVRSIVDKAELPDWKKEDLQTAITALEAEIDKSRTRIASILDVIGKMIESPKIPEAIQKIGKVITIIQDAEAAEKEKAKLAGPPVPKRIEDKSARPIKDKRPPPSNQNGSFEKDLDDEIPF